MPNLDIALSENFRLWEFVKSAAASRNGIENIPNETEIANLRRLCQKILQPARDALGPLKINSGFRSAELNRLVGGSETSDHRLGLAADVNPFSVSTRQLAEWIVRNCPEFDQVILEFGTLDNPDYIHLSLRNRRNRKQVLRATRENGRIIYSEIRI